VRALPEPSGALPGPHGRETVRIDARRVAWPLTVRSRQPGDALRPCGLGGRKKLQDLFVDRKVPRAERDRVPVVVDALDEWCGWRATHSTRRLG
jgi:tRNA(Ile)-lysidine synthase